MMLQYSPTRSRLRAIGHSMLPKLLRRIGSRPAELQFAKCLIVTHASARPDDR